MAFICAGANSDRQLAEAELRWWCGWAARSRLRSFRHLAQTIRQYLDGILAYFDIRLTPGAIEAVHERSILCVFTYGCEIPDAALPAWCGLRGSRRGRLVE